MRVAGREPVKKYIEVSTLQVATRKRGGRRQRTPHSDAPRPSTDIRSLDDVRALLGYVLAEALEGDNSIARGRLLVAIAAEFTRCLQVGELETRLAALEAAVKVGAQNLKHIKLFKS